MSRPITKSLNCVVIGDDNVGKTCLLITHTANAFPHEFIPTVFDNYAMRTVADSGEPVVLSLFDTASPEEDWFLKCRIWRDLYSRADVFLVCFSIVSPSSFENVKCKWLDDIESHAPNTPIVLVGTKLDLRDDAATLLDMRNKHTEPISHRHASALVRKILAHRYVECSALTKQNVSAVFDEAVR
ncbi:Ras-like C3 botulinum toxin substrate 1 [Purpureocillium lilacinum]|uniref:Ras-like C3 botulinum toxin substrate 1 n=1 Tax=Purpureocillium lilacinum TaxID=33203 RepID=A0A179FR49_PURLI|nr:Ras-like C3 botulinum toxin substrate 1 [Purpureocillium lilacinum]